MASNAIFTGHRVSEPVGPTPAAIERTLSTRHRIVTRQENAEELIDLGLRAGVKVSYRSAQLSEPLDGLIALANSIKEFETLPPGWDSYGAAPLSDKSVSVAIEIAIQGLKRCQHPRALPLPDGGLGLRFDSATRELEIDVGPDGGWTAVLEDLVTGETTEVEQPTGLDDLLPLVNAYCRAD
jgi:hypothetical protein